MAVTDEGEAQVILRAGPMFDRLPEILRPIGDQGGQQSGASTSRRRTDFELLEPYTYELHYRVIPPHGFSAARLPEPRTDRWGSVTRTETYKANPDRSLDVTFTLTAERRRLSPAEFERLRGDVSKFLRGNARRITFRADALAALEAGKLTEAYRLARKQDDEHPGQAAHAMLLARVYLAAGLGEAARHHARLAVERAPKAVAPLLLLAEALGADLAGRTTGATRDLIGAEAAYRKALELDPEDKLAKVGLAALLQGPLSRVLPTSPRLAESERMRRPLAEGNAAFNASWWVSLYAQGRWEELRAATEQAELTDELRWMPILAAALGPGGLEEALKLAGQITDAKKRREGLRIVASEALNQRRYPLAKALFETAAEGHERAVAMRLLALRLGNTKRLEDSPVDVRDAGQVARRALALLVAGYPELDPEAPPAPTTPAPHERRLDRTRLSAVATPAFVEGFNRRDLRAFVAELLRIYQFSEDDVHLTVVADFMEQVPVQVDGDAQLGYRVLLGFDPKAALRVLLAPTPEGLKVIALGGCETAAGRVHELLRKGDRAAAERWFEWSAEEPEVMPLPRLSQGAVTGVLKDSPLVNPSLFGNATFLKMLQSAASAGAPDHRLALLVSRGKAPAPSGFDLDAVLRTCAGTIEILGGRCAEVLVSRLWKDKGPEAALAVLRDIESKGRRLDSLLVPILFLAGKPRKAELTEALDRRRSASVTPTQKLPAGSPTLFMHGGDFKTAAELLKAKFDGSAGSAYANDLAWVRFLLGDVSDATLDLARKGVEAARRLNKASLHTLATVLAERGEIEEASRVLREKLGLGGTSALADEDYYVLGRMTEAWGAPEAALTVYRSIEPRPREGASSMAALAARRIQALATKPRGR